MTKTAAVIAEYNPFHKGHIYHIEQTRKQTGADCVISLMSGSFVQRGAPAFADKYTRARCALGFADLVLELPAVYALSSAEGFASGAVSILDSLGGIDFLSFGTEAPEGCLCALRDAAKLLAEEPAEYSRLLKEKLALGISFPAARAAALSEYTGDSGISGLLGFPNNILAVEYIKALIRRGSSIEPVPIRRIGSYLDTEASDGFAGAAAVRKAYMQDGPESIRDWVDEESMRLLSSARERTLPVCTGDTDSLLSYAIAINSGKLNRIYDVSEALANRIEKVCSSRPGIGFEELADALSSRELTRARICRGLAHILLDIRRSDVTRLVNAGYPAYARILGFNRKGREFLSSVKKSASVPLISNCADAYAALSPDRKYLFDKDILATNIYNNILRAKYGTAPADDFRSRPVIL